MEIKKLTIDKENKTIVINDRETVKFTEGLPDPPGPTGVNANDILTPEENDKVL